MKTQSVELLTEHEQEVANELAGMLREPNSTIPKGLLIYRVCQEYGVDHHKIAHHLGGRSKAANKPKPKSRRDTVELKYDEMLHETELAYLLRFDTEEEWIPKSQVESIDEDNCTVELPEWLVLKKGLENYEVF